MKNQFNDGTITVTQAEYSLDGGINLLNTYGAGLTELSGAAGSKTGTYTSAEAGAILAMAQQIYSKHYKNAEGGSSSNLGALGFAYSSDMQLLRFARQLAARLSGRSFERV